MKNKIIILSIISIYLCGLLGAVPIDIFGNKNTYLNNRVSQSKVIAVVNQALSLQNKEDLYLNAKVKVKYNSYSSPDYLVVFLQRKDTYSSEIVKIDINSDYSVASVTKNYELQDDEFSERSYSEDCNCPDPSVEFVAATPCPEIPTASAAIKFAVDHMKSKGYNAKSITPTVQEYKNYLSCPKLKGFYSIGHGYPEGLILLDGSLTYSDIAAEGPNYLRDKVIYFNSCDVHVPPLEPAIINAGAKKFIGGNIPLWIGTSEEVSRAFWVQAEKKEKMDEELMIKLENDLSYPDKGAHGISGSSNSGSDLLFLRTGASISQMDAILNSN